MFNSHRTFSVIDDQHSSSMFATEPQNNNDLALLKNCRGHIVARATLFKGCLEHCLIGDEVAHIPTLYQPACSRVPDAEKRIWNTWWQLA